MPRAAIRTRMRPEMHIGLYVKWLLKLSNSKDDLHGSTIFS